MIADNARVKAMEINYLVKLGRMLTLKPDKTLHFLLVEC